MARQGVGVENLQWSLPTSKTLCDSENIGKGKKLMHILQAEEKLQHIDKFH